MPDIPWVWCRYTVGVDEIYTVGVAPDILWVSFKYAVCAGKIYCGDRVHMYCGCRGYILWVPCRIYRGCGVDIPWVWTRYILWVSRQIYCGFRLNMLCVPGKYTVGTVYICTVGAVDIYCGFHAGYTVGVV